VCEEAAEEEEKAEAGYRIKNKNTTQRCGEKSRPLSCIDDVSSK